jgi:prolyl oligopeptidase
MNKLTYPETPSGNDVDVAAGIAFPDPYRWLEGDTNSVRAWQDAQNQLACQHIQSWPHYETLRNSVSKYSVEHIGALPRFSAGKWFRAVQETDDMRAHAVMSDTPYGAGCVIAVPARAGELRPIVSWISPSPDGCTLAMGVCSDGSERNYISLFDTESGEQWLSSPPQLLMDAWTGGAAWLPDSSGFYFLSLEGDPNEFKQRVLFYDLKNGTQVPAQIPLPDPNSSDYTLVNPSPDGRYLIATHGLFAPKPIALLDLSAASPTWRPFVTQAAGTIVGTVINGKFVALTDVDAPRGRIVTIPVDAENPSDPTQWTELLPQSGRILRSVTPVGERLYITEFVDTYSSLRTLDLEGTTRDEVTLPERGAIEEPLFPLMNLIARGHPAEYHFVFSSFTTSWGVYRHIPGTRELSIVRAPLVHLGNATVQDRWAVSKDGTRIPYHTVALKGSKAPAPALLYGYGAFNLPLLPAYPGAMTAFVAAGGVYVHVHIRGGAELGRDWWHAGRLKNKQNGYEDLYAVAEDVASHGLADRSRLALTGRSNGGLMACVAVAQRSDLWRVVVPQVPVTDLIGVLRDPYGYYAVSRDYADPTDRDEVIRLSTFSPYHLIEEGVAYPPVLIQAGATDPRCPPWHARKMIARLQANKSESGVTLLRVRQHAGHGAADGKSNQQEAATEGLAFIMQELGMRPA